MVFKDWLTGFWEIGPGTKAVPKQSAPTVTGRNVPHILARRVDGKALLFMTLHRDKPSMVHSGSHSIGYDERGLDGHLWSSSVPLG